MVDLAELVGASPAMEAVRHDIRRLVALARDARRLPAVLVQGETGTGKGLIARLLHRYGPRTRGPFVDLNCAAIPETLLEGELFGYERGAFTDARRAKAGLFQSSTGGVLFLDEVGLLPEILQGKLLTALDEGAVRRLGSTTKETFDSWLISATNADLEQAVRERRFREDLYHRLAVVTLQLPPLRERAGDAVLLAERALERACRDYGLPAKSLAPDARSYVARSPWPGNVRQLANVMERLALLVDRNEVRAADVEAGLGTERPAPGPAPRSAGDEREQLLEALEATGWNIMQTAARLGLSRNTVRARMDRLGLRARRESGGTADRAGTAPAAPAPAPSVTPPPVAAPSAPVVPPAVAPSVTVRWERRHVALLRIVVGGAAPSSDVGPMLSVAIEKAVGFGGRVEGLGPFSLDVSFGVVPIENSTRRAVSAALALHKAVLDSPSGGLVVTTVIHTESTTIGQTPDAIMIDASQRPALTAVLERMLESAGPGVVHVSAATAPFVERHFELRPAEGAPVGVPSFTVVRPDPTGLGAWRAMTRFVGRAAEMELFRNRWELAQRGRGQAVGVVGEPGVGKSRLLLEFVGTLQPEAALVARIALSASEDPSRSNPASALVAALFGIEPGDEPARIREKVAARLQALDLEPALLAPMAAIAGVEIDDAAWTQTAPSQRTRRTLDGLRRVIARESVTRPVVMVVEDLHWIDADTQIAMDHLIDVVPAARVLLLLAYREEYRHDWGSKTFYTQLRLDPLPMAAAEELLADLVGTAPELAPFKRQLTLWTEGNPFFLEEGVRMLVEQGALVGAPGALLPTGDFDAHTVPATVEDTLAARINRLPGDMRHVLQCAAAIGTDFDHASLTTVADLSEAVLDETLRALEDAEFVYRLPEPERAHTFKHALTHLVAYRSVPPERARTLHARILAALEARPPGQRMVDVEAFAEHAIRGEIWPKAVAYLRQAGARALGRSANRVAADYFERALASLARANDFPERDALAIDLRLDVRHALTPIGEVERILGHLRDAEAIAIRAGDTRRLGRAVSFQTNGFFQLGDHAAAVETGRRALTIARALGDEAMAIAAEQYIGRALHAQGSYRNAVDIFLRLATSLTGQRAVQNFGLPVPPSVFARSHLVWCLGELGEFDEALRVGEEAIGLANAIGETGGASEALQWAYYPLGIVALERGDLDTAIGILDRIVSICATAELPTYLPRTNVARGHAQVLLGRAEGVSTMESAVATAERQRQVNVHTSALVRLGDAYRHLGRFGDAMSIAERALEQARRRGERGTEARALRLLASTHHRGESGKLDEAETLYRTALGIAGELDMRPQAALCRLGLGALYRVSGRADEAREMLRAAEAETRRLGLDSAAAEAAQEAAALG